MLMKWFLKQLIVLGIMMACYTLRASGLPSGTENIEFPEAEVVTENTVRIPFKTVGHLIVIKAGVNEREGNFIIDTGSETLLLNNVHFKHYNKRKYRTTTGVNNSIDKAYLKRLDHFFLKGFSISNIDADIVDLSHIEKSKKMELFGIIGYKVLKDYEVFIDFYLKQITLFKVDENGNRKDKHMLLEKITDSLAFRQKKHTIILDAFVNGKKLSFGLDSGAEINQLNSNVPKSVLENFRPVKRINMVGAGNGKKEVIAGKLYRVKLSETVYAGMMRTILTRLSGMYDAYGTHLDGIIGYEFLAGRRVLINYKKKKLYFIKHPYMN